jgi:predicted branched-subunit amino acid permease
MNKKQVRVMWIGIALIILTIPLWVALTMHVYGGADTLVWICLLLEKPIPKVIAIITIGLVVTFRDKKDDKSKDEQKQ